MRVLHIITGLNVGGAEAMLGRLIDSSRAMPEIASEIIALMEPGVAGQRLSASGAKVHTLGMRGGVPSVKAALRLAMLVRRIRPDIVMGWMHHGQIAAAAATLVAAPPPVMVWNVRHSLSGYDHEKPLTRLLLRIASWLSRWPATIVYNSHVAREQYRAFGFSAANDLVIPNGFDARGFAAREAARRTLISKFGVPSDGVLIGLVARNHEMKDVPNLVAAFAEVRACRGAAHLLIVGEGMDAPSGAFGARLASLPAGSFTLSGHRTDVTEWLAGLDIVTLPSAWGEGFPNIVGEAMAAGVPCAATDVGDTAWVVGSAGRVVRPRDSAALAGALLELVDLGESGRRALGGLAASRINEHFALPGVVERYAELFRTHARRPAAAAAPARGGACVEATR